MNNKILSIEASNIYIKNKLVNNEAFNLTRIGYGELNYLYWKYVNFCHVDYYRKKISDIKYNMKLRKLNIHTWPYNASVYKSGLESGTIQAVWEDRVKQQYLLFNKLDIQAEALVNASMFGLPSDKFMHHWSDGLQGKRILIVSPFEKNVLNGQHKISDKLWSTINNPLKHTEIECITAPIGFSSKKEYASIVEKLIEKINLASFDIALLGCSVLGLPLNKHIYQIMGKSAIYVGGALQLYFGIDGKRWQHYDSINANRNSYWIKNPIPKDPDFIVLDNATYW